MFPNMLVCDNCNMNKSDVKKTSKSPKDFVQLIESVTNLNTQAIRYYRGLKSSAKRPWTVLSHRFMAGESIPGCPGKGCSAFGV